MSDELPPEAAALCDGKLSVAGAREVFIARKRAEYLAFTDWLWDQAAERFRKEDENV